MMERKEVPTVDWHRIDIVAALHKKGLTMRDLSRQAGLSPDSLKNVLYRPCPKYKQIIAGAIGVSPDVIWPSRYSVGVA